MGIRSWDRNGVNYDVEQLAFPERKLYLQTKVDYWAVTESAKLGETSPSEDAPGMRALVPARSPVR